MSIASKIIAGCSTIAGRRCPAEIQLITVFWGPTTTFFPAAVLVDSGDTEGTCILAPPYYADIAACAFPTVAYAYACDDTADANPNPDTTPQGPWPNCDKEAA